SHFNLDEALEWIARINPKRAILTNLHSDMDYAALRAELPPAVEPAYDLMSFVAAWCGFQCFRSKTVAFYLKSSARLLVKAVKSLHLEIFHNMSYANHGPAAVNALCYRRAVRRPTSAQAPAR